MTAMTADSRRALVRTDANLAIGTGHLARCLTLADALAERGWIITFAVRTMPAPLRADLEQRGHFLVRIPDDMTMDEEPAYLAAVIDRAPPQVTIVDHYGITAKWHRAARAWSERVMAIDDQAIKPLDVDLLLNQNLGEQASSYDALLPASCKRLIGPAYALLRPQFRSARGSSPRIRKRIKRIHIFLSGGDQSDATATAARAVAHLGIACDVVIGAAYPYAGRLRSWAASEPSVALHQNVADMASLMQRADLAIGAPSSASWERCCLGLPAILVTLADNQVRAGKALAAAGAAIDLGWYSEVTQERLASEVAALQADHERLAALSQAAAVITDGCGAERVSDEVDQIAPGE